MRVLGLTGSIGMGKSTTAALFRFAGVPVYDADAAVHRLYAGRAVGPVEAAFPGVSREGAIDRDRLARAVLDRPDQLARLEAIVHPLVREEETRFVAAAAGQGSPLVVLDIPLLFETGARDRVDMVVVVSAPRAEQRARVLARPGMTEDKFAAIEARQLPDAEKRRLAHIVIDTGRGHAFAGRAVAALLRALPRS